ncbi:DUF7000 family protein [Vagococcus acidifermentans]|uniref:DUF7000 domain-containing protein n=1 Tax=Vagococcus acidifermentans TaxID=564710 RepID=A0A430AVJ1_9ENTE|nr:hypothetical protein [Vagococcus acidifermentans]RSU12069.1 hypothetical protein CBF27_06490 [Vagococcus acidifermentans]
MNELTQLTDYYREQLEDGKMQQAYHALVNYVMKLKISMVNHYPEYKYGNVSQGYMDYTYFSVSDEYLRSKKLRFGIVFNHRLLSFELWLIGQNTAIQKEFWQKLRRSRWLTGNSQMPCYAVMELSLISAPDFSNTTRLTEEIMKMAAGNICAITDFLKGID